MKPHSGAKFAKEEFVSWEKRKKEWQENRKVGLIDYQLKMVLDKNCVMMEQSIRTIQRENRPRSDCVCENKDVKRCFVGKLNPQPPICSEHSGASPCETAIHAKMAISHIKIG